MSVQLTVVQVVDVWRVIVESSGGVVNLDTILETILHVTIAIGSTTVSDNPGFPVGGTTNIILDSTYLNIVVIGECKLKPNDGNSDLIRCVWY